MNGWHFQLANHLQPWVLVLSLALAVVLLIRVWRRTKKAWRSLRLGATLLVIFALTLVILQPANLVKQDLNTIILATARSPKLKIDSLKNLNPAAKVLSFEAFGNDLEVLFQKEPTIEQIYILGDGLPTFELKHLGKKPTEFHLNPPPAGIIEFSYDRTVKVGQNINIQGIFSILYKQ